MQARVSTNVVVKRRVPCLNMDLRPIHGKFKEEVVDVPFVRRSKGKKGIYVQLPDGAVIYRKMKDVVSEVPND